MYRAWNPQWCGWRFLESIQEPLGPAAQGQEGFLDRLEPVTDFWGLAMLGVFHGDLRPHRLSLVTGDQGEIRTVNEYFPLRRLQGQDIGHIFERHRVQVGLILQKTVHPADPAAPLPPCRTDGREAP